MTGIEISFDSTELQGITRLVDGISNFDRAKLLSMIGALGESQTRRRIEDEKTAPDGSAWPPNAEGTPILHRTGQHLLNSISWIPGDDSVEWGAGWEFAHIHQHGATITPKTAGRLAFSVGGRQVFAKRVRIPARPFLGISADNATEILELVTDFFSGAFGAVPVAP